MSDPRVFKGMMMSNPKMKEMVEKNPELNQMLNDPSVIGDVVGFLILDGRNDDESKLSERNAQKSRSNAESFGNYTRRL